MCIVNITCLLCTQRVFLCVLCFLCFVHLPCFLCVLCMFCVFMFHVFPVFCVSSMFLCVLHVFCVFVFHVSPMFCVFSMLLEPLGHAVNFYPSYEAGHCSNTDQIEVAVLAVRARQVCHVHGW